jgi:CheY-like chemotaxis protein/anti-sigma regulatory factor (Ser/Thr protein kinase)
VLSVELPPTPVTLDADPLRLSQAISNLLTNAAKYTDAGGRIGLVARVDPSGLEISVSDTGIGLPPEAIPSLFEMFSQVESATDRTEGGLGIGLALVRGLIELHGGTVEVASDGPGRGSTFTLRLPPSALRAGSSPGAAAASLPAGAAGARVIVADDNHDAADALAAVLGLAGCRVEVAYGGDEALALAEREPPDALILDVGMPGMSGHALAREIRRRPWGKRVLLAAVTGWGQETDKARSRDAGFDHHLTKPVDPEEVERLVAAARAMRLARGASPASTC